jgi:hypothetical protein
VKGEVCVDLVNGLIIVHVRGHLNRGLIKQRHAQIVQAAEDTQCKKILMDLLDMEVPAMDAVTLQQAASVQFKELGLRIAIVVRDFRPAYLGRLAYGEALHRVFYDDLAGATAWLASDNDGKDDHEST